MLNNVLNSSSRKLLIEISADHFIKNGYKSASIGNIARMANITKSTVYHHFTSKMDLAIQTIQMVSNFYENNLFYLVDEASVSSQKKADKFIRTLTSLVKDNDKYLLLISNLSIENIPALAKEIKLHKERWTGIMKKLLLPLYSEYQAEKLSRCAWKVIMGAYVADRIDSSTAGMIAASDLELCLRSVWLQEI